MDDLDRMFPMLNGPWIPWWLAQRIHAIYIGCFGDIQSLERIGERGGFGWDEVNNLFELYKKKNGFDAHNEMRVRFREPRPERKTS